MKQVWIDWLGPERIFELYAGTEAQAATVITGTEWLAHRGSVGRPAPGTVMICDSDGTELPAGEEGEVWLRTVRERPTYRYVGATARTREGGWESLGDMGWLDADGYLHLGDRLEDMILTGGANVYPAEVEAAMQEHPEVRSVVVIGLPDDDLGNRVHAIVEADPGSVSREELLSLRGRTGRPLQGPPLNGVRGPASAQRSRQGAPKCLTRRTDHRSGARSLSRLLLAASRCGEGRHETDEGQQERAGRHERKTAAPRARRHPACLWRA